MTVPGESPSPAARGEAGVVPVDLGAALTQMAGLVLSRETVETALALVTRLAAATTAGTTGAGVTVVDDRGRRSRAASDPLVERADGLQYDMDEGPCLTAWRTGEVVRIDDTASDDRWPRWNTAAAELGVRSVLSVPLRTGTESVGAMKVYGDVPGTYGPHDEQVLQLLGDQAAILLANSQSLREARRLSRQLTDALTGRDTVSQAVGILLAKGAGSSQEAFARLAAAAQQADRPVGEIAAGLIAAVVTANAAPRTG